MQLHSRTCDAWDVTSKAVPNEVTKRPPRPSKQAIAEFMSESVEIWRKASEPGVSDNFKAVAAWLRRIQK